MLPPAQHAGCTPVMHDVPVDAVYSLTVIVEGVPKEHSTTVRNQKSRWDAISDWIANLDSLGKGGLNDLQQRSTSFATRGRTGVRLADQNQVAVERMGEAQLCGKGALLSEAVQRMLSVMTHDKAVNFRSRGAVDEWD